MELDIYISSTAQYIYFCEAGTRNIKYKAGGDEGFIPTTNGMAASYTLLCTMENLTDAMYKIGAED
jgi:hypothetical protein